MMTRKEEKAQEVGVNTVADTSSSFISVQHNSFIH